MPTIKFLTSFIFSILLFVSVQAQYLADCPANQGSQNTYINGNASNPFPNELDGFKFFAEGKFNALNLGVSRREDAEKIFGAPSKRAANTETYDYDSDWLVRITYFDSAINTFVSSVNGNRATRKFEILPKHFRTIASVQMLPKKTIPFIAERSSLNNFGFTGIFSSYRNDSQKLTVENKSYQDLNGLIYIVDFNDFDSQGNFKWIEYLILPSKLCKMYIERK